MFFFTNMTMTPLQPRLLIHRICTEESKTHETTDKDRSHRESRFSTSQKWRMRHLYVSRNSHRVIIESHQSQMTLKTKSLVIQSRTHHPDKEPQEHNSQTARKTKKTKIKDCHKQIVQGFLDCRFLFVNMTKEACYATQHTPFIFLPVNHCCARRMMTLQCLRKQFLWDKEWLKMKMTRHDVIWDNSFPEKSSFGINFFSQNLTRVTHSHATKTERSSLYEDVPSRVPSRDTRMSLSHEENRKQWEQEVSLSSRVPSLQVKSKFQAKVQVWLPSLSCRRTSRGWRKFRRKSLQKMGCTLFVPSKHSFLNEYLILRVNRSVLFFKSIATVKMLEGGKLQTTRSDAFLSTIL